MSTPITRIQLRFQWYCAVSLTACCLFAGVAGAQSGRSNSDDGTQSADLQLSGPANTSAAAPAPAAKIDFPSVDDAITKGADSSIDIDSFIAGDPPAIRDPERQSIAPPAPDLSAKSPLDADGGNVQQSADPVAPAQTAMKPTGDMNRLEQRVERLEKLIEAQSTMLAEMARAQSQMTPTEELKKIREEIVALRNSFQTVARPDLGGTTNPQSPVPRVGKLIVENLTGVGYTMNINGYDVVVMPGRREIPVEVGRIVTEIRGFEAPKSWNVENFQQVGDEQQLAIQIQ